MHRFIRAPLKYTFSKCRFNLEEICEWRASFSTMVSRNPNFGPANSAKHAVRVNQMTMVSIREYLVCNFTIRIFYAQDMTNLLLLLLV
jgi:hypothetical protein